MEHLEIDKLLRQGEKCYASGNIQGAKKCFQKILTFKADQKDAINNLGVIYFQEGEIDLSIPFFYKVLEIDNRHLDAMVNLAKCLHLKGDFLDALIIYRKISKSEDSREETINDMADCFMKLGDSPFANKLINESLKKSRIYNELFIQIDKKIEGLTKISSGRICERLLVNKTGLEIGGPSNIFKRNGILPLYHCIKNLDGVNFSEGTVWEGVIKEGHNYLYEQNKPPGFQYILDAVDLSPISNKKYDFVISSHCLEHIANPIKALKEWIRVLKDYGYLLAIVPHKDETFDHKRPVISLEHLVNDYNQLVGEDDLSHLSEILMLHDLTMDKPAGDYESFRSRSLENFQNRCLHHHVFNTTLVPQLFDYLKLEIVVFSLAKPIDIIVLGRKLPEQQLPDNSGCLSPDAK